MAEASNGIQVSKSDAGVFQLSGDLNRNTVMKSWPQQKSEIRSCKANNTPVRVDFSKVEQVDTAGLAWAMHLLKACKAEKVELEMLNLPNGLIKLAKLSNVNSILSLQ